MRTRAMMRRLLQPVGVCLVIFVVGCKPAPQETTLTVDYYRAHPQEREAKLRECRNNPGELSKTPNCINAGAASGRKSLRDLPPMGLRPPAQPQPQGNSESAPQ